MRWEDMGGQTKHTRYIKLHTYIHYRNPIYPYSLFLNISIGY